MGDLAADTAVTATTANSFGTTLSPDWEIWGPNGGYLAAVAMRAAGIISGRARPASINAHFVGAGRSGDVDITTSVNRETKVGTSITVSLSQEGRPWMTALVWGVDDDLPGLQHQSAPTPDHTTDIGSLASTAELMADADGPRHPFWSNLDQRPLNWIQEWDDRAPSDPSVASWVRFVPTATFVDPWIDAARSLILIDLDSWPAATRAHVGELEVYAPTIEVSARFIASTVTEPWLLSEATTPRAEGGLIAATAQIWNRNLELVALGGSTLLCRPAVRRPDR